MLAGMLVVACAFVVGTDVPEGLEALAPLVQDEPGLVQAMRAFDVRETALGEAELREAEEKAGAGDQEAAEAKRGEAAKRFQQIRAGYEYVIRQYPSNAKAQTYYGEVLYDRFGELPGALRAWQLASSLDPRLSTPLNNLAIHYCHCGDYVRGLNYYDRAIMLDPSMADYRYNLAQTYLVNFPDVQRIRKWDKPRVYREAMKLSKRAKELAPDDLAIVQDYAVNFYAGEDFGVNVKWKDAAKAWRDVRPLAHSDDERFFTWLNEARVWIRAEDRKNASACLDEALKIRPDSDVAKKLQVQLASGTAASPGEPEEKPAKSSE